MFKAILGWFITPQNLAAVVAVAFLSFNVGTIYGKAGKALAVSTAKSDARKAQKTETETTERATCAATLDKQKEETDAIYSDLADSELARANLLRIYSGALSAFDKATGRAVSGTATAGAAGTAQAVSARGSADNTLAAALINDFTTWQNERIMLRAFQEKCK